MDRIIQTLDRLDQGDPSRSRLAKEALENLEAYRLVLTDSRGAMVDKRRFRLNGESVTVEEFLNAVPGNVAALEMIAGGS